MTGPRSKGQVLVELALALPILLILLAGAYAIARTGFLVSRAESASFAEALRVGRNLSGIEPDLARSILPGRNMVEIRPGRGADCRLLPEPLPFLAGRTTATVKILKTWNEAGGERWLGPTTILRKTELSSDCWGKDTSSGKRIRQGIRAGIALGAIR